MSARSESLLIDARTENIARGRRWVTARAALRADPAWLSKVELLASELIANAVLHGSSDGQIPIRAEATHGNFRVEVDDGSTAVPALRRPPPEEVGGRGMLLVDMYSARWGCEPRGSAGKTVWFEMSP